MRTSLLKTIGGVLFSIMPLAASSAYGMDTLQMTHSVYLGGLYMGSVATEIEQSATSYSVRTKAITNQSMRWMFSWTAKGATMGTIAGLSVKPTQHTHISQWKDKKRGADITYDPSGKVTYSTTGKKRDNINKYTLLDPKSVHNSLDPMSMVLAAILEFEKNNICSGTYPVFDGRRRYDVILSDGGFRYFKKSDYSVFEGKAAGCKLELVEKGGFKREKDYELEDKSNLIIWVGSLTPGGRVVPVRMEVQVGFGALELHLERYRHGATKLASKKAQ